MSDAKDLLVSSETDGILTTRYRYDAAGRLIGEGGRSYRYGWLDKVVDVSEEGQVTATFGYHAGGQLAAATHGDKTESFLWDGLALIRRDGTDYVNEPHAGGGAPVLAGDKVLFNDRLGSTLGIKGADGFSAVQRTAFGETGGSSTEEFFTGKPMVGELGYAFLFRNYRPEQGKWQTADPLGYPDGWNQLAYCNGHVTDSVDFLGALTIYCHDLNNSSAIVTDAGALVVGNDQSGDLGAFAPGSVSASYGEDGKVIVNINISLWVKALPFDYQCFYVEYLPHSGDAGGQYGGAFYEVVLAHERGHASYFFGSILLQLTNYLNFLNVDGGRFGSSISSVVNSAFLAIYDSAENKNGTGAAANQATYDYFSAHPIWGQLSDRDGRKRWQKYE